MKKRIKLVVLSVVMLSAVLVANASTTVSASTTDPDMPILRMKAARLASTDPDMPILRSSVH